MRRQPTRVLVLDASATRRARYQKLLEADPQLRVVGVAASDEQALALAGPPQVDVLLIGHGADIAQTVACVRHIMQTRPLPIVVVVAGVRQPDEAQAFELISAGALSVLHQPQDDAEAAELRQTLRLMAEVKVVRRWKKLAPVAAPAPAPLPAAAPLRRAHSAVELVVIGASTGGPIVLKQLLGSLPGPLPVPIVIVQHMAQGFVSGLANWLSTACAIRTEVALPGTRVEPGRAYLAPDSRHLRVGANRTLLLDAGEPVHGHRPAVACLFESVARQYGRRCAAILLTGMGQDGAAEMKQLKDLGAITIAQDRASSVVHGMPGEAIRLGAATFVMTPSEIAAALPGLVSRQGD